MLHFGYFGSLFESLVYSMVWTLFSAAMIWLHSLPGGGHKQDLTIGAIFFGFRSLSELAYAWALVVGNGSFGWYVHLASAFLGIAVGFYGSMRLGNFAITLIRSERVELIEKNRIGDGPTADMMLPLASESLRRGLEEVQKSYEDRGITCQPKSGTMFLQHSRP